MSARSSRESIGCGDFLVKIVCGVFGSGMAVILFIVILGSLVSQGAWEIGEEHNIEPAEVIQAAEETSTSLAGTFVIALVFIGMIGLVAIVGVSSIKT